ncbi:MAG TPA: hypothetical protein VLZ81_00325, partial [Blastocatellia bacterium]|nr:hypothetical protein [Blastocatellia bacterium]
TSLKKRLEAGEKLEPAFTKVTEAVQTQAEAVEAARRSGIAAARAGQNRLTSLLVVILFFAIVAVSYRGLTNRWPFERKAPSSQPPIASPPRPITYGKPNSIPAVAVSRDGRYFAYAQQDTISILKTPTQGQDTEETVRPPLQRKDCSGLIFSADGSYLYWVARSAGGETHDLYRIPVQGDGAEEKIIDGVNRSISFSPDGSRFAFVRNGERALGIANSDGSDEKTLSVLTDDGDLWVYPAWSPDGKVIACGVMNQKKQGQRIYAVSLQDGSMKAIGPRTWMTVLNLAWMGDGRAIIANAAEDEAHAPGLWHVSYPDGAATRITVDPYGYYGASLSADSGILVSSREGSKAHLYVAKDKSGDAPIEISAGLSSVFYGSTGLCWAPDGKVIYDAGPAQRRSLYEIDPGAEGERGGRRMTFDGSDSSPDVTPNNQYIVFASDRGGKLGIWRMDRDGGNPVLLAEDGLKPSCLLEGRWVVYQVESGGRGQLWKVPINGGTPEPLVAPDVNAENASVSPDGQRVAFLFRAPDPSGDRGPRIAIIEHGKLLSARYGVPPSVGQPIIRWSDKQTLVYVDEFAKGAEIWQQRLEKDPSEGHGPTPAPHRYELARPGFKCIFNFDRSADGKFVLSAGDTPSVEVYELTLTTRP